MEAMRFAMYTVWTGVGLMSIVMTVWGSWYYTKLWKNLVTTPSKKEDEE